MIRLLLAVMLLNFATDSSAAETAPAAKPIEGRVEHIESGAEPLLPSDLQLDGNASDSVTLPESLTGEWFGTVRIKQMDTYPSEHDNEPYCQAFIAQIHNFFKTGMKGELKIGFVPSGYGGNRLASSDIFFGRGLRMQLTMHRGKALVPGGYNIPRTIKDQVRVLGPGKLEQSRYDFVQIVDAQNNPIHQGFTEVTAYYKRQAPGRILVKILNVDYDQAGKPLWKALMEGYIYK